jgi:hypothetical protein
MSTSDPHGTLPMFEVPAAPKVFGLKTTASPGTPKWSKYRPKNPVKCDDCLAYLAQNGGNGPATNPAKFKRTVGAEFRLLCYPHAEARRQQDGLPELKEGMA